MSEELVKPRARDSSLQVWGIPKDLREKFKRACMKEGTSMREAIEQFMEEVVDGRHKETLSKAQD